MRSLLLTMLPVLAAMSGVACARTSHAPAPVVAPIVAAVDAPAEEAAPPAKKRMGEVIVYVDGKPLGAMRALELPPSLKARAVKLHDGLSVPRFTMNDYLASLGIDVKRVKALDIHAGQRASTLTGDELRRIGDRLMFSFTAGSRGKPRIHWPHERVEVPTTVDMVSNLAVYIDKEPPTYVLGKGLYLDGQPVEGVPYVAKEQGGGTRVYVDGVLVGSVKRKQLTDDLLVAGSDDHFALTAFLKSVKAPSASARTIDFVAGDELLERDGAKASATVAFSVPPHSHGKALVSLPAAGVDARVSAIEIYAKTTPPARIANASAIAFASSEEPQSAGQGSGRGADEEL